MSETPKITDITKEYPKAISAENVRFALGRNSSSGGSVVVINLNGYIVMVTAEDAMSLAGQLYQAGEFLKENPEFENKLRN